MRQVKKVYFKKFNSKRISNFSMLMNEQGKYGNFSSKIFFIPFVSFTFIKSKSSNISLGYHLDGNMKKMHSARL